MRKMVSIFGIVLSALILSGCGGNSKSEKITLTISRALFDNAEVLYKSEINRMRVAYNIEKRVLIYHFWKVEQFVENGTLFFHVYPEQPSNLPDHRKGVGFLNKNIKKEMFVTHDSINYYLALKMPDYAISKITTGQFIKGKRNWHVNKTFQDKLSKNDSGVSTALSLKNQLGGILDKDLLSGSDMEQLSKFQLLLEMSYAETHSPNNSSAIIYGSKSDRATAYFSKGDSKDCTLATENSEFNGGMTDEFLFKNSNGCVYFFKKE